jgi:hypothetical protein
MAGCLILDSSTLNRQGNFRGLGCDYQSAEMVMDRSPNAPLSPHEVAALQILNQDHPKCALSRRHRELLSMGLAVAGGRGTEALPSPPSTPGGRASNNR